MVFRFVLAVCVLASGCTGQTVEVPEVGTEKDWTGLDCLANCRSEVLGFDGANVALLADSSADGSLDVDSRGSVQTLEVLPDMMVEGSWGCEPEVSVFCTASDYVGCCSSSTCTSSPASLAADSSGLLFIAESALNRIVVTTDDGEEITSWGFGSKDGGGKDVPCGQVGHPVGVGLVDGDKVVVAEEDARCISLFDYTGNFLESWSVEGCDDVSTSQQCLWELAVDLKGTVFLRTVTAEVIVYDLGGNLIGELGQIDLLPSDIEEPLASLGASAAGIAVDKDGRLLVLVVVGKIDEYGGVLLGNWVLTFTSSLQRVGEVELDEFYWGQRAADFVGQNFIGASAAGMFEGSAIVGLSGYPYALLFDADWVPWCAITNFAPTWSGVDGTPEGYLFGGPDGVAWVWDNLYLSDAKQNSIFAYDL